MHPLAPVGPALSERRDVGGTAPDEFGAEGEPLGFDGVADGDDGAVGAGLDGGGVGGAAGAGADYEDAGWGFEGLEGRGVEERGSWGGVSLGGRRGMEGEES